MDGPLPLTIVAVPGFFIVVSVYCISEKAADVILAG
jgi:hypothetical protein